MKLPFKYSTLACALVSASVANTAVAQDTPALEEVTVTAQKRTENLQEVPVSVSTIGGSELEMFKYRDAGEIAAQIPNLQTSSIAGDGFPVFSLRGVSMSDFSFNQSSPVASYVDEVYKGNPAIQGIQLFDLERIEVLRGPQGTLYGKNSTGGAINFITRKPSFEAGGYLTAGVGSQSRKEVNGAFDIPLIDDVLAFRLAGTWTEADGWFENTLPGVADGNAIGEYGIRASLLWQPTETLEAILRFTTGEQKAVNYGIQPINISADGVGAGVYGLYKLLGVSDTGDYYRDGLDFFEFESNQDEKRKLSNDAVALTVNWDMTDTLALTSISSWDSGDIFNPEDTDGSPLAVIAIDYKGDADQISQDLRITSDFGGDFNFIAGLYYAKENISNSTTIGFYQDLDTNADGSLDYLDCVDVVSTAFFGAPVTESGQALESVLNEFGLSLGLFFPAGCQTANTFDQDRTSAAGYFDGNYVLNDAWTLRAGLRYTEDKTELSNYSARLLGSDDTPLINTIPGDPDDPFATAADDEFTDKEWTGKVGIDYLSASGMLLYASFSHGYRSGAFNSQAFFDPSELTQVAPEKLDSYEVGFKHEFMDGRVRMNAAAFYYQYKNQQFLNIDSVTLAQTLINIEKSTIKGLEIELYARPLTSLMVKVGLGLLDSQVDKGMLSGIDLKGNELLLAPKLNFNLAADWEFWQMGAGAFTLHGDANYVGDHYFEVFNLDRLQQDGYWVANASLQFVAQDDRWQAALWVKNIAEEKYWRAAVDLATFGFDYSQIGAPRTFGANVTFRF